MIQERREQTWMPLAAWALVAAAGLHLVLWAARSWYRIFGPYLVLRFEDVAAIVTGIAPFLLAAAILIAAERWPSGRRWLLAGAALSAGHGVLSSANFAFWSWQQSEGFLPQGGTQLALVAGSMLQAVAGALVPLCLAVGLWTVATGRRVPVLVTVVASVIALVALAGAIALASQELSAATRVPNIQAGLVVYGVAYWVALAAGAVGWTLLAVAAVRALPDRGGLPEGIIASGALVVGAGSGLPWLSQALVSLDDRGALGFWLFSVPAAAVAIGLLLVIVGFAAAATHARGEPGG